MWRGRGEMTWSSGVHTSEKRSACTCEREEKVRWVQISACTCESEEKVRWVHMWKGIKRRWDECTCEKEKVRWVHMWEGIKRRWVHMWEGREGEMSAHVREKRWDECTCEREEKKSCHTSVIYPMWLVSTAPCYLARYLPSNRPRMYNTAPVSEKGELAAYTSIKNKLWNEVVPYSL